MKFLSKLWFGEYSLLKTYWLFALFIPLLLRIPIKLWDKNNDSNLLILFLYLCLISTYSFISLIGLWRSSDSYKGNTLWCWFAKLTVIIGFILQFLLMVQTFLLGSVSYPIWYLVLVGTILFCFSLSVRKNDLNNSAETVVQDGTTKEFIDENILWEQVAKEYELSRNEGLWARLFVENNGDEKKAKVKYLAFRFNELLVTANSKLSPPPNTEKSELNSSQVDINVKESENEEHKPPTLIVYIKLILILILIPIFLLFLFILLSK